MSSQTYSPEQQARDVQAARQHDPDAWGHLYDHHFPAIYAYVASRLPTTQDAEDLVSETWERAVRHIDQFSGQGSFAGWLFQIARRLIADFYRRPNRVEMQPTEKLDRHADGQRSLEAIAMLNDHHRRMQALIRTLSPRRQEVIVLRYFSGLRNQEIAEVLELDERTVASHLNRGLADLQARLMTH